MRRVVHLCRFDSADHLTGRRRTYEAVKAAVLKAGRYSVFEATASMARARQFQRLDRDPDLVTEKAGFPWISVRLRSDRAQKEKGNRAEGE